jgi:polyferredoxin
MYTTLWGGIGIGMIVALFLRDPFGLNITPVRNPLFVTMSDGSIRNAYEVRLRNQHGEERPYDLTVESPVPLDLAIEEADTSTVNVAPDSMRTLRVYLTAPANSPGAVEKRNDVTIWVTDLASKDRVRAATVFNGKGE